MLKPRSSEQAVELQHGRLLVEVQVTLAVKANSLEQADALVDGLLTALHAGDHEQIQKLREDVSPESWRSWVEYDDE